MGNRDPDVLNKLAWITCPYCGSTFRVAVLPQARSAKPVRKEQAEQSWEIDTACPGCKECFVVECDW